MHIAHSSDIPEIQGRLNPIHPESGITHQLLVPPEVGKQMRMSLTKFSSGFKNRLHIHHHDQIIYVLSGKMICATETEERVLDPGTAVYIPEGEKHRHGAPPEMGCSLLSIATTASAPVEVVE